MYHSTDDWKRAELLCSNYIFTETETCLDNLLCHIDAIYILVTVYDEMKTKII
jgi:hypothetical protein